MILEINPKGKVLSVTREEDDGDDDFSFTIGYNFGSIVNSEDSVKASHIVSKSFSQTKLFSSMLRFKITDVDKERRFLCISIPENKEKSKIVIKGIGDDGQTESRLRAARLRMKSLFDNLPVALIVVNDEGIIEAVNPTCLSMFSYTNDEIKNKKITGLISAETGRTNKSFMQFLIKSIGQFTRLTGKKREAVEFPIEIFFQPIDESGDRFILSVFDISEKVEIEQMKQEFLEMVSHDLRSPLTNFKLFISSITKGRYRDRPPENIEERAKKMNPDLDRMLRLVDQLLEIEKIEQGHNEPDKKELSTSDLIDHAVTSVSDLFAQKEISFELPKTSYKVLADSDHIIQVITNFLANAIKFSPQNSSIKIVSERKEKYIEIRVIDQGPGIPREMKSIVFERYRRIERPLNAQGSGLGLAICKNIISKHGGSIGVDSMEGSGSEFWFTLPVIEE